MHADHSLWQILAHAMIAFLFLFRGIGSLYRFDSHLERFRTRRVPFPKATLIAGFVVMLTGGTMVLVDVYAWAGAAMLILFTILANLLYHDFWSMTDPQRRMTHLYFFCNNIAVMGGLMMVIATSA